MHPLLRAKKAPKVAPEPTPDKLVGGNACDELLHFCSHELFQAVKDKDPKAFRHAIEAIVIHQSEDLEDEA